MRTADPAERTLLFLSCDLTGSTRYKQQAEAGWQLLFLSFYREFPQKLADIVKATTSTLIFRLWKPVGDELIFTCEVSHERHIAEAVRIWLKAMREYEESSLRQESLGTKGGAFTATFPGPDSECSIPRDPLAERSDQGVARLNAAALANPRDHDQFLFDYIGPSIDTGFRITSSASPRYFALSMEVAWALWMSNHAATPEFSAGNEYQIDDLTLLGTKELKGVWGGREYPMFAIDTMHDDAVHRALRNANGAVDQRWIGELCAACCRSEGWPTKLFLPDSSLADFKAIPVDGLARYLDNAMEGVETAPDEEDNGSVPLEAAPPLPDPRSLPGFFWTAETLERARKVREHLKAVHFNPEN